MNRSQVEITQTGVLIILSCSLLLLMGLASIYVTNTHYAEFDDGPRNAVKQLVRILLGLAIGLILLRVGYFNLGRFSYVLFFLVLLLLVPLFVARLTHNEFGGLFPQRNGAYRWINLPGFPLQPSELMKVTFVLALAWYLRYRDNYRRFSGLLVPIVASSVPLGLILLEPDLGTCLLLVIVLGTMLFMAGARIKHLAIIGLVGLLMVPIAWQNIKGYQRLRVTALLLQSSELREAIRENPSRYAAIASRKEAIEWASSSGYQLVHSKNAIGSGRLTGYGWGNGMYCNNPLLPDRHNDFIFALIAHQWGLFGAMLVLLCYGMITLCGILIASSTHEPFARLLAVGITSLIFAQVTINIGMTLGLMPITGMTLPFVSYGGSGLLTNFISIALLISVSRHRPFLLADRPFDFSHRRSHSPYVVEPGERAVTTRSFPHSRAG
ncbi:MAG: FtsW/RodA/SpoVE family cell cycle protein [Phycisphaerae bacterium]